MDKTRYTDKLREQLNSKLQGMELMDGDDGTLRDKILNVLVLEDSPSDYMMLRKAFSDVTDRYKMTRMENGYEAIKYFEEDKEKLVIPDLIILDLRTPKVDGEAVLKYLRQFNHLAWIPVFIITAAEKPDIAVKKDENTVLIKKPITKGSLLEAFACFSHFWYLANVA